MSDKCSINSYNNFNIASISDGELLNKLEFYKLKLYEHNERLNYCSEQEVLKTLDEINKIKCCLHETILKLESIVYVCSNSRSLI